MPESPDRPPESAAAAQPTTRHGARGRRVWLALRVVQVRMRFVAVLLVAFLVVGLWGNLRNIWDTWTYRLTGAHAGRHAISEDTEYFCPMDPGVVSGWPAICPVCNMDLVRRKKGDAVFLPEGLVARMQFSPYRIHLAGIKTSTLSRQALSREIVLAGRLIDAPGPLAPETTDATAGLPSRSVANPILECEAYAGDLPLLKAHRRAEVSFDGLTGIKPAGGTIVEIAAPAGGASERAPRVHIRFDSSPRISSRDLRAGMFGVARVTIPWREIEPFASMPSNTGRSTPGTRDADGIVGVPETAVVETGGRRVVYVETMPGMFDGVEVTLGPRCGDFFPVVAGLEAGQKVAAVGAFLIDAEARLSRNLEISYFGAARETSAQPAQGSPGNEAPRQPAERTAPKTQPASAKNPAKEKLSAADRQLVKQQKTCPVTDLSLDAMGGPIAVDVAGRRVFICCKGCESKLKQDPEKYLAKLKTKE